MKLDVFAPMMADGELWTKDVGYSPRPVVVFYYGGTWKKGSRAYYRPLGIALSGAGFAVAIADYRLFPEVKYPAFMEDAAAALSWVQAFAETFGGDPGAIRLMGHSAGAHMSALLCLDPTWLEAENLSPTLIRKFVGLAGPYSANLMRAGSVAPIFEAASDKSRTRPIKMIAATRPMPPSLLLHGSADRTVGWQNSQNFANAIRDIGGEAQTEFYNRIGHIGLLTTLAPGLRWRAPSWERVLGFLGT